jgi:hypothetical protein
VCAWEIPPCAEDTSGADVLLDPDQRPVSISWIAFSAGGCGDTGATTEDSERGVGQRVNFPAGFSIRLSHRKAVGLIVSANGSQSQSLSAGQWLLKPL